MGVTPSGPLKANSGVRSGVAAAGKVLEGDDQQIYVHYITIANCYYYYYYTANTVFSVDYASC